MEHCCSVACLSRKEIYFLIKTVTLNRNQQPTKEQIQQIEAAAKRILFLMKILLPLPQQWRKPFRLAAKKSEIHKRKQVSHNF